MSIPEQHIAIDITADDVADYQKLCKEKLGKVVAYEEAHQQLHKLVLQMHHVYRPITNQQAQELEARD